MSESLHSQGDFIARPAKTFSVEEKCGRVINAARGHVASSRERTCGLRHRHWAVAAYAE